MNQIVAELAGTGALRAGINMSNGLLVTGMTPAGNPEGVAPDMAAEIANRLNVPVAYVKFDRPSKLADAAGTNVWDIGLIGAEPARAKKIAFTPAYCEIEATYLVRERSPLQNVADVDRPGSRIAVRAGSAYDLWLTRNLKRATLHPIRFGGRTVQPIRRGGARCAGWSAPCAHERGWQASGRQNPARQFHRGPTSDRHLEEQHCGRRVPSGLCRRGKANRICCPLDRATQSRRPLGGAAVRPRFVKCWRRFLTVHAGESPTGRERWSARGSVR